jgi:hypothetical protein
MKLSTYKFPEITETDLIFPTVNVSDELLKEATKRNENHQIDKAIEKFNELFFSGGKIEFKDDVKGTWKENAFMYCKALMGSFAPKHEHKELVCSMILDECIVL